MQQQIINKIKEFNTVIIHRHKLPDGDALGSQIGLKETIKNTYPEKRVFATGDQSDKYNFIGNMDQVSDEDYQNALVIVLDSGNTILISDERYKLAKFMIKIDHHTSGTDYADINYVDNKEISCASLIARLIFDNNMKLSCIGARALFTGLVTDSSRFLHEGVNSNTLYLASKLLEYDFSIQEVYQNLYVEDFQYVKVRALLTLSIKQTKNKVAYIKTSYQDLLNYELNLFTVSRGMVNVMAGIKGIDIWVSFTEDSNGAIYTEIRSSKYNVAEVAVKYGGGGHRLASGTTLSSFEGADKLLEDLDKIMEESNER